MRILFTICGRAGSKGVKNKNIRNFIGKPLPYYTLSLIDLFLKKRKDIEYDIVVNSDSNELINMMENNSLRKVDIIERDKSLAGDTIGKIDVIRNCYEEMTRNKSVSYDIVVDADITSPLRTVNDIENLIDTHTQKDADVTTSVTSARRNPYFNQVKKTDNGIKRVIESNFTARQQAPEIFDMNASLYAYKPEYLSTNKGVLDGYCEMIEMHDTAVLDIDNEDDFEYMQLIAQYLYNKDSNYRIVYDNV